MWITTVAIDAVLPAVVVCDTPIVGPVPFKNNKCDKQLA